MKLAKSVKSATQDGEILALFESRLIEAVEKCTARPPINDAIRYSLFPAGKRIRPLFLLSLAADISSDWESLIPAAIAIEIVHNASLVHDDLPEMDNDDMRRGRPSCHRAFSVSTALLAGDFMVPWALEVALTDSSRLGVVAGIGTIIARGYADVCSGQALDMLPDRKIASPGEVYALKTGALFRASAEVVAISMGLNSALTGRLSSFGESFGVSFQIVDDYMDRFGSNLQRGRNSSSDERNQKITALSSMEKIDAKKFVSDRYSDLQTKLRALSHDLPQSTTQNKIEFSLVEGIIQRTFDRALLNT